MVFRFAPSWQGNEAHGNMDLTQAFSDKRLKNLAKGVFFASSSFGGKFEFRAYSSTCPPNS
jgi:hypothetical protein